MIIVDDVVDDNDFIDNNNNDDVIDLAPPRPTRPPEPLWHNIPLAIVNSRNCVNWQYRLVDGRWTKKPVQPDGSPASSTDTATWAPYEFVQISYETSGFDGIGVMLVEDSGGADALVGVDFDHCVENGAITDPIVVEYIKLLDSYTEISPSDSGLRVFAYGILPPQDRKCGAIEIYSAKRFLTVTGNRLADTPTTINHRCDQLAEFHARVFAERIAKRTEAAESVHAASSTPVDIDDMELLDKARGSKRGDEFAALYDFGDISRYPSQSEADAALCRKLAFWCGRDQARVDRLFRSSGLMRSKWNRADYRERTISGAIANCRDVYGDNLLLHQAGQQQRQVGRGKRKSWFRKRRNPWAHTPGLAGEYVDEVIDDG